MLIPHHFSFKGLDPRTTPQLDWGNLNPLQDYATDPLLSMAIRSIYISCSYDQVSCKQVASNVRIFVKVAQTGGKCSTGGSCTDWQEIATGGFMCGACPPIGTQDEFCCASLNTWYLQQCDDLNILWFKVGNDCSDDDWMLVAPTETPVMMGTVHPRDRIDPCTDAQDGALCCLPLGSKYIWKNGECNVVFTKIGNDCHEKDWHADGETCVIRDTGAPDHEALCDYPNGTIYLDITDPTKKVVYLKVGKDCEATDWCDVSAGGEEIPVITGDTPPDHEALCELPLHTKYIEGSKPCQKVYVKCASNCDADDWEMIKDGECLSAARRNLTSASGMDVFVPYNTFQQFTGLTQVQWDYGTAYGTPMAPAAEDDRLVAPCDGLYEMYTRVNAQVDPPTAANQSFAVVMYFNGVIALKMSSISHDSFSGDSQQDQPFPMSAGDFIGIGGFTNAPDGQMFRNPAIRLARICGGPNGDAFTGSS